MASTTVSGGAVSVSAPPEPTRAAGSSSGPLMDVMAIGSTSDPQSEDGEDQSRREQQNALDFDEMDDHRPRMSPNKRRLDDPEMDFGQTAKKRRKQYKPVRIAVPAASTLGEETHTLSTVYTSTGPGIIGPEDEGYEGEDGEYIIKYDDMREGLQARLGVEPKCLPPGNMQQVFQRTENSFKYKCFECEEVFASNEALAEHDELVHQQKVKQPVPVQMTPSTEAVNPAKPLDLAQSQIPNSAPQSDFSGNSWPSENSGVTSTNATSENQSASVGSSSQLPPIPFAINAFNDGKILIPNLLGLTPPFLLPHIPEKSPTAMVSHAQSSGTTVNTDNSSSTVRIFNPEAYCELCNKEFCNKYFLKTHKANKHGIYSDTHNMSAGSGITGVSFSSSFTQPMPSIAPSRPSASNASFNTQKTQTELNSLPKSSSSGQMKINCEVCHKKFSNRYVVLRHRAKVHGLMEENLIGSDLVGKIGVDYWPRFERDEHGNTSTSSETGSIPLENQTHEGNTSGQMEMMGDSRPFSREKTNVSPQMLVNKSSPSVAFKMSPSNSFSEFNMDHEETKQQLQQDFSTTPIVSEITNSTAQTSIPPHTWASYQAPPSTSTSKISSLPHDRLRKLGVINADAFCEICCKEYCNKYFLRTHKLKRHGIVTPDLETKGGSMTPGRGTWNQIQTSPLNLIVGEQSGSQWNAADKSTLVDKTGNEEARREGSTSNGTSSTQTDLPESEDLECNVCGRHFQSHYLMQMHKAYMHPPQSSERNAEELSFSEAVSIKTHTSRCNSNGSTTREDQSPNNPQGPSMPSENSPQTESNTVNQTDYASGNLQKIQTMIMQLNKFSEGKMNCCTICNKEVEDKFILRSHMVTEHGVVIEDDKDLRNDENSSESSGQQCFPSAYCSICKKDFFAKCFLKKHITEFHGNILPKILKDELKETLERGSNPSMEKRASVTPTSSYCEICNKELCNKYFMKTHMQRMHGIEIENGSQIGGVICDICNKELCSKYFLRVHKQNTHGIVEDPGILQQGKDNGGSSQGTPPEPGVAFVLQNSSDLSLKPADAGDLAHRYFTHFTEVCPICNRRFRSTKWLKSHLMNDHSEMGVEKWKEIEMQYQIQLQQTRQTMIKPQTPISFSGKSDQDQENEGSTTPTPTWKANIGTQSELSINYSEAGGSSGMRRYSNETDVLDQENSLQPSASCGCDQKKTQQRSEHDCGDSGNRGEKVKSSNLNIVGLSDTMTAKNYHCSFCPFKTPVLAYLFVHEKTHAGVSSPPIPGTKKQLECPICHLTFGHTDMFHHHLVSHQYSGIIGSITTGVPLHHTYNQSSSENRQIPQRTSQKLKETIHDDSFQNLREPIVEVVIDETGDILGVDGCSTHTFKCSMCRKSFKSQELLSIHAQNNDQCLRKEAGASPTTGETTPSPYSPNNNELNDPCPHFTAPSTKSLPPDLERFKCMQCPFATEQIATLKKHIMKEHPEELAEVDAACPAKGSQVPQKVKCGGDGESDRLASDREAQESPGDPAVFESGETQAGIELRRRLQEAAKKSQVPASYAVPQRVRLREDGLGRSSFIMQPFLLEEPEEAGSSPGDGTRFQSQSINGKFVPSLVFLPVREKLSKPLTVSFSLTPA